MKRLITILCMALLSQQAFGMIVRVSLDDMVQGSTDIVQGRVIGRESHFTPDESQIITEIEVAVDESWLGKNSAGKTLRIQTLGGIVGDVVEFVEHQPVFGANEEVVLFVEAGAEGKARIHNDIQGKFAVGGEYVVGFDLVPHSLSSFRQKVAELAIKQEGPR